jgi:O-antigen ligase
MKAYRALFVTTVASFIMPNFPILFGRIGFYARYFFLAVLILATVVYAIKRHVTIPATVLASFYLFITYALLTAFWTENVALSVTKWIIYVALVVTLFFAGAAIPRVEDSNPFWPMKWILVPIVLLSFFALLRGFGWVAGNFRGYCGNSNALGATIALTSPWLMFELRRKWSSQLERAVLLGLTGMTLVVLLFTYSRASIVALFIIATFAGSSLHLGRKFLIVYALIALVVGTYLLRPATFGAIYRGLVEKRAENVLTSRSDQLEDSWEAAKKGGIFGAGFGVSIGSSKYWNMESFSTFAREKGNSMLAIVEELGLTGLAFYLFLLYAVWSSLMQVGRRADADGKFLRMLGLGFFLGAIFHSAFEAWFLSSGPDIAVFWSTIGLLLGTLTLHSGQRNARFSRLEKTIRPAVFASSPRG